MLANPLIALSSRSNRVYLAVLGAAGLGLVDLCLTYRAIATQGMCEANPVARTLIDAGPLSLVLFKLATIGISSGLLLIAARRAVGEIGAWVACLVMASVMVVWIQYLGYMDGVAAEFICQTEFRRWS